MSERVWLDFLTGSEQEVIDEKVIAPIKSVLETDYSSKNVLSGVTRVSYKVSGAWLVKEPFGNSEYVLMDIPETAYTSQTGAPMLVREGLFVAIPKNAVYNNVRILNTKQEELCKEYNILPCPEPVLENESSKYLLDTGIYNSDQVFPRDVLEYIGTEDVMGVMCAHIYIHPVQFRPLSKKVSIITELEFEVTYDFTEDTDNSPIHKPAFPTMLLGYQAEKTDEDTRKPRLLIITTKALEYGVRVFEGVKSHTYDVSGVLIEDIFDQQVSIDKVRAIKDYIMAEHVTKPLSFVMLAGDASTIPTPLYDSISESAKVAYDNYYCCTEGSVVPLFPLARVPANTKDEIFKQLNIAAYFFRHQGDTRKKVCLTTDKDQKEFRDCKENIAKNIQGDFDVIRRYDTECTKDELIQTINTGVGFLNFRGHGSQTLWGGTIGLNRNDVKRLVVGNNTPVVFSIACSTAAIQTDECFGVTWMSHLKAVSFLGASTPSYRTDNSNFDKFLWEAIHDQKLNTVGEIFQWATLTLYRNGANDTVIHNIKIYLLLGDPTADYKEERPNE